MNTAMEDDKHSDSSHDGRLLRTHLQMCLLGIGVSVLFVVIYNNEDPYKFLPRPSFSSLSSSSTSSSNCVSLSEEGDELDRVLRRTSMEDKTVIITNLNQAWAEPNSLLDLFLESFRIGNQTCSLLNHLVIVALDQPAYNRCLEVHPHCYYGLGNNQGNSSTSDGNGHEAYFMTPEYLKLVLRKIDFLNLVLEKGYNFVFTDTDILWLQNPFHRFHLDADIQMASDHFVGNPWNLNNRPNTGLMYVKSNCRTKIFFNFWNSSRETFPGLHDQDVLNKIKYDSFISKLRLTMKFLDTAYFGGFCEYGKDLNVLSTIHANCRLGLSTKVRDLSKFLQNWKKFMSSKPESSSNSLSVHQNCSVADFHLPQNPKGSNNERRRKGSRRQSYELSKS